MLGRIVAKASLPFLGEERTELFGISTPPPDPAYASGFNNSLLPQRTTRRQDGFRAANGAFDPDDMLRMRSKALPQGERKCGTAHPATTSLVSSQYVALQHLWPISADTLCLGSRCGVLRSMTVYRKRLRCRASVEEETRVFGIWMSLRPCVYAWSR